MEARLSKKGLQKKVAESPRSLLSPAHVLLHNLTMNAPGKGRWQEDAVTDHLSQKRP